MGIAVTGLRSVDHRAGWVRMEECLPWDGWYGRLVLLGSCSVECSICCTGGLKAMRCWGAKDEGEKCRLMCQIWCVIFAWWLNFFCSTHWHRLLLLCDKFYCSKVGVTCPLPRIQITVAIFVGQCGVWKDTKADTLGESFWGFRNAAKQGVVRQCS